MDKGSQSPKLVLAARTISVNSPPVLTVWTTAIAERLVPCEDDGLSLGKSMAAWNAEAKRQRDSE